MKKNFKMAAFVLGAMSAGILGSCTAESGYLNEPAAPNDHFVNLVKSTEVNAFANGFKLLSRAESDVPNALNNGEDYDYGFPENEFEKVFNMAVPSNATNLTSSSNDQNGTYLIPAGETVTTMVPNNFGGTLYIAGTYKPSQLGNNSNNMVIYILPEGELEYSSINNNNGTIYNAGKLNLANGFDGVKIKTIYSIGDVIVSNPYGAPDLPSDVSIYSKGGYVEFNTNGESWATTDIKGTLVSDNIVKSNGKIKFQSGGYRDICHLISTDLIEITDGSQDRNTFGWIEGTNIKFDGCKVRLHPHGLVEMSNEVNIPNSACSIEPYDSNSRGLVKCNLFSINMINMPIHEALKEGIYLNTNSFYLQSLSSTYTNFNDIISALSNSYSEGRGNGNISNDSVDDLIAFAKRVNTEIEVTPSCGEAASVPPVVVPEEPIIPMPNVDPEEPETPETPEEPGDVTPEAPKHVEVNLEVEEHADYLATHLSIHVRAVTDVEVFIPIEKQYYVAADDMDIVQKHDAELMVHGGPKELEYAIAIGEDNTVTVKLTVEFEEEGIRVKTEGITEELIEYLDKTYGDGLTFEIWNYYNAEAFAEDGAPITMKEAQKALRDYLEENIATVEFTNEPPLYVNAFFFDDAFDGDTWTGYNKDQKNPWDCTVRIVDNQKDDYEDPDEGWWYNNAPFNQLQKKKGENQP